MLFSTACHHGWTQTQRMLKLTDLGNKCSVIDGNKLYTFYHCGGIVAESM